MSDSESSAVKVKLPMPVLNSTNVELWFIQIEHWFTINKILIDKNKFSSCSWTKFAPVIIFNAIESNGKNDRDCGIRIWFNSFEAFIKKGLILISKKSCIWNYIQTYSCILLNWFFFFWKTFRYWLCHTRVNESTQTIEQQIIRVFF